MKIEVLCLEQFMNQRISLGFSGDLSNGERVSFTAAYNEKGELVACSSPYSSCDSPDYYIEIAEYFQKMKDVAGQGIVDLLKEIRENEAPLKKQADDINLKSMDEMRKERELKDQLHTFSKKLNRFKNIDKINECNANINHLMKEIEEVKYTIEKLNKELSDIYLKIRNMEKFELAW